MILGIGTDIIKVNRFNSWLNFSRKRILRVFSEREISEFTYNGKINIQSLACRFAAKEAFYKALSYSLIKLKLNKKKFFFLFSCKNIEIFKKDWGVPMFKVNWSAFEAEIGVHIPKLNVCLSISHEKDMALAVVIISD